MAYCPGPTLAEWLARRAGPVPVAQAVWLVSVLADAVQHAHEHGIIHRDLKPGNILLFPARPGVPADAPLEAEWFTPRVADFGVARLLDAGDRTRTGQVVGTLAYMAPEQADGDGSRVGPAADVYSLGVILYELLTGEKPFAAAGPEAVLARVLRAEPRPPRAARREIPPDLEAVCLKCLEKDPRRRYPSAAALAEDLRRFRSGLPTRARPEGPLRRAWRAVRRRPALAGMAALTGLALLAVLAVGARYSVRLIRTERALHAAREVARAQEFFALLEKVRQRRVEPYPGWADDSLADLARLAAMQPAAAYLPELRSEAASCLRAVGLTPLRALAEGFPTYSLAFSPDGETLALGGWYGGPYRVTRLRLVEAGSGRVLRELSYTADAEWEDATQRADACAALAFGPGGRPLAAGTRSARVFVWDLTRPGDPPLRLAGHTRSLGVSDTVRELVFDAERPVLFSSGGHELIGWDLDSPGREVLRLPGARLPRGVSLARGALAVWRGREIHLLDLATYATAPQQISWGNSLFACPVPAPGFAVGRAVALASGARLAYAANRPGDPDRPYHPFRAPEDDEADLGRIIDLAFSPDGSLLATTSAAQRLKLWSPLNLRPLAERPTGDGSLRLAFHPGGRRLAVADENRVVLYALPGRGVETAAADCGGRAFDFDASGAGTLLYADTERSDVEVAYEISFWPVRAGAAGERPFREVLPGTARNNVPLTAAAPGGGFAFTRDDGLGYWDGRSPGSVRLGGRALEEAKDIRFGPDGRLWAAAGHEVRAWRVPDGGEQVVFRNPPDDERAGLVFYAVAPGRERVLAGRRDGRLFAFDPAGGHLATWRLGESPLTALALA
ncbi:MAG TPA: serine/threonine-protein kinase, partial [Gemmataceae bacterium]